ncbi:hypothetical protein HQ545_04090 [Candidatus Woesearchaeota archaeon]|nr:hypothetical protein [Candidatus Woesearchaeota archaeon]
MNVLEGSDLSDAMVYIHLAAEVAQNAVCLKSQRGCVLVKDGEVIGEGYNAPADSHKCVSCLRQQKKGVEFGIFNTEPCYSVHAEQRAIINALRKGHSDLEGSVMYHVKLKNGGIHRAGTPSCTICSKLVLESGISWFVNFEEKGAVKYSAKEFNDLSMEYVG